MPATPTQAPRAALIQQIPRLRALLADLRAYAAHVGRRVAQAMGAAPLRPNKTFAPALTGGFRRAMWAISWTSFLSAILTGQTRFTYTPRPKPTQPPQPAALKTLYTYRPGRGRHQHMRRVFATQPIGQIVTRICTALNIPQTATLWPTDLVAITQTPAEWSATLHTDPDPAPAPAPTSTAPRPPPPPGPPPSGPDANPLAPPDPVPRRPP